MIWVWIGSALVSVALAVMTTTPAGRRALATAAATIAGWMLFAVQHLAPELAAETAMTLAKVLEVSRPSLLAAAAVMLKELTGQALDGPTLFSTQPGEYLTGNAVRAFDNVAGAIAGTIAPPGDLTPASGMKNLEGLFGLHLGTSLQAWGIDMIADMLTLGKLRSVAQFHAAIDAGLGFRRLGMLMWRMPIEQAISIPLQRYYQQTYTFGLPDASQAVKGWYSGVYTDNELLTLLQAAGYNQQVGMELLNIEQRHLTLDEGTQALRMGLITSDAMDALIRADTLGPDRGAIVRQLLTAKTTEAELASIATTARDLYRAGDVDEASYRQYLQAAHWRDDEIALALTADQLALRKDKLLTTAQLLDAYKTAVLTGDQVRARFRQAHYDDAEIDILFALQTKTLSASQVVEAYLRGGETKDNAVKALEKLGYSSGDAANLILIHAKNLSEGQVLDALKAGSITTATARADLVELGYDSATADILLGFAHKTLTAADVQAALTEGLLTSDQAHAKLLALGYSDADATLFVELKVRQLTTGQTLDAYADGLITRSTAIADLQKHELSQLEATQLVQMFDAKAAAAAAKAVQKAAVATAEALAKAQAAAQKAAGTSGTSTTGTA